MTSFNDQQPCLDREEKELVERIDKQYAPMPMTPAEQAAFDEALEVRLRRRRRTRVFVPAFAAVAVVGMMLWITFSRPIVPNVQQGGWERGVVADSRTPDAQMEETRWAHEVFFPNGMGEVDDNDEGEIFPDEYLAIEGMFLDPVSTLGSLSSWDHESYHQKTGGTLPCIYFV